MTVAQHTPEVTAAKPVHTRALIIGSGFAGLGMGIELQQQTADFVILEKAADVGGTWRDNTYPGCACDVPAQMYSFSFAPNPDWSHIVLPAARDPGLPPRMRRQVRPATAIRFGHESIGRLGRRRHSAGGSAPPTAASSPPNALVSGAGGLHEPPTAGDRGPRRLPGARSSTPPGGTTTWT